MKILFLALLFFLSGCSISYADRNYPLHDAAADGSYRSLRALLADNQDMPDFDLQERVTQTYSYINADGKGFDINEGFTPLHAAVYGGRVKVVQLLLEAGADPLAPDVDGRTPLDLAMSMPEDSDSINISFGEPDIFDVPNAMNIFSTMFRFQYPLHWAAASSNVKVFKELLAKDSSKKSQPLDQNYKTAFCIYVNSPTGEHRIESKCINPFTQGMSPLHIAALIGEKKLIDLLLKVGADVNARDILGITPLWLALKYNKIKIAQKLLDAGADLRAKDNQSATPAWFWLLLDSDADASKMLSQVLVDKQELKATDNDGNTALHILALVSGIYEGAPAKVQLFLDAGLDPSAVDNSKLSPLHHASKSGDPKLLELLLAKGANVNATDLFGDQALVLAAQNNRTEIIPLLLKAGANVNNVGESGSALFALVDQGYLDRVSTANAFQTGVDFYNNMRSLGGEYTAPPIFGSGVSSNTGDASPEQMEAVRLLLEAGADPNIPLYGGINTLTAMDVALEKGQQNLIQLLWEAGALPFAVLEEFPETDSGNSHLLLAAIHDGEIGKVRSMLAAGADVNDRDPQEIELKVPGGLLSGADLSPLHLAVAKGDSKIVRLLLAAGANPNIKAAGSATPLHYAVIYNHPDILRLLLAKADSKMLNARLSKDYEVLLGDIPDNANYFRPSHTFPSGSTALMIAAMLGRNEALRQLLAAGADMSSRRSPLYVAAAYSQSKIVEELLARKEGKAQINSTIYNPLSVSCSADITRQLLRHGADASLLVWSEYMPRTVLQALLKSCPSPEVASVAALISAGVDINYRFLDRGETALFDVRTPEMAKLLIDAGIDVNVLDSFGQTSMYEVLNTGILSNSEKEEIERHLGIAKLLIRAGQNINVKDEDGRTPLFYARNLELMQLLLDSGARLESRDKNGNTPLYLNIIWDRDDIKTLLNLGARAQNRNDFGMTPLHILLGKGNIEDDTLNLLLEAGADLSAPNANGKTPLDILKEKGWHNELLKSLQESNAGAK